MKLLLKHITPYLPYKLKIYEPVQEKGLELDVKMTTYTNEKIGLPFLFQYGGYKIQYGLPILRPLDDLFTNKNYKTCVYRNQLITNYKKHNKLETYYPSSLLESHEILQFLFKHHFDVFGLIEKNLAIDINTLTE